MQSGRVYGLDGAFAIIHEYKYIELEWTRKYYEPGEFTLYCGVDQYDPDVKYVMAEGRKGIGIAQKLNYETSVAGEFITLQGFFLEKNLDYYTTDLGYSFSAGAAFSAQLKTYLTKLGISRYAITDNLGLKIDTVFDAHKFLGEEMRSALQGEESAYELSPAGKITFWKGKDSGVTFAKELGNVSELSYETDISNVRQRCKGYIKISSGAYDVKNVYTGDMLVTATYGAGETIISAEFQPDSAEATYTAAQLRSQIKAAAKIQLLNYMEENSVDITVLQAPGSEYLKDYDLGDTVKVATTRLEAIHSARITEITELWKNNMSEIAITIGNKRRIKR